MSPQEIAERLARSLRKNGGWDVPTKDGTTVRGMFTALCERMRVKPEAVMVLLPDELKEPSDAGA